MSQRHDGLVLAGLDVVVDEGDKCCVTTGNNIQSYNHTYCIYPNEIIFLQLTAFFPLYTFPYNRSTNQNMKNFIISNGFYVTIPA